MTRKEAIKWLNKLYARADITDEYGDMEDMQPYDEAINSAINSLEIDERYELEYERCCNDCILYETDACTRAGRAVNDEPCEDFIGAESEDSE